MPDNLFHILCEKGLLGEQDERLYRGGGEGGACVIVAGFVEHITRANKT